VPVKKLKDKKRKRLKPRSAAGLGKIIIYCFYSIISCRGLRMITLGRAGSLTPVGQKWKDARSFLHINYTILSTSSPNCHPPIWWSLKDNHRAQSGQSELIWGMGWVPFRLVDTERLFGHKIHGPFKGSSPTPSADADIFATTATTF